MHGTQDIKFFITSVVGIATHYGLNGAGFETRWGGRNFPAGPESFRGPPSLLYDGYHSVPGVKRPGRGIQHPPPISHQG